LAVIGGEKVLSNLAKWLASTQDSSVVAMAEVMAALEGWAKSEHGHAGAQVTRGPAKGSGPQRRVRGGVPHNDAHDPPYWDETGNLTNSIRGEIAEVTPVLIRGVLTAGMEYGVFLELARNGKWAFLWPTIINHEAEILAMLKNRIGKGVVGNSLSRSGSLSGDYERFKADVTRSRRRERHFRNAEGSD